MNLQERCRERRKKTPPDLRSAVPLKKTSMSLSAASDLPQHRDIVSSGFLPKSVTQHLPLRIKVRTPLYKTERDAIRRELARLLLKFLPDDTQQAEADDTGSRLQAPPDKLDPGRSVETLGRRKTIGHLETSAASYAA